MSNFDIIIKRVLSTEAGYVNNPKDPGGETKFGICKRSYPKLDIPSITWEIATALYKRDFYDALQLGDLPLGIANQLMDFAVNSGGGTASRAVQRALRVADDGHIGPVTLAKMKETEPHDLIMRLLAQRLRFMRNCANWPNASRGWVERIAVQLELGADDV